MTPRLLAISWEMPPLSGPRALQVSRLLAALARHGWESTVIAVAPRPGGPLLRDTAGAPPFAAPGVDVVRVASPEETWPYRVAMRALPSLAYRPDRQRGWLSGAVQEAERRLRTGAYRCVVTFAQPWTDHLVGLRLRRDVGLPWLAHFSDPWADSPYLPTRARARAQRFEAEVVEDADALVFVNEQTLQTVMAKHAPALRQKAHVVPHGYDRRLAPAAPPAQDRSRLKLVYTGRFYDAIRGPEMLFSAIARFRDRPDVRLFLIGPGMRRYQPIVRRFGIDNLVVLSDAQPYEVALREAATADVLVTVDADTEGASMFLPSKLVDYLMLRKPILGITPPSGASADLLRRLGFQTAAPRNVDEIAAAIDAFVARWKAGTLDLPPQFDSVAAEYDIDRTSAAFAGILNRWR